LALVLHSANIKTYDALEVGRGVDGAWVVILIKCAPEWGGAMSRARGLLARASANSGAAHQIIVIIVVLLAALLVDTPDHDTQNTQHDGTADTNHHTDDDLLVGIR